jgi:glutamyl/glutaminyl-tRNA synthetase
MLNFLAFIGWSPRDEREVMTAQEFTDAFEISRIHRSGGGFNVDKLDWFNREHIKKLSDDEKKAWVKKFLPEKLKILSDETLTKLVPIITERIDYFGQITEFADAGEYDYFLTAPEFPLEKIVWKTDDLDQAKQHIKSIVNMLQNYTGDWSAEGIKSAIWDYAESVGRGSVLWPMRYTLSGRDKSPDPFVLASILGRTETLDRLSKVINTD